jgi:hypothetical protein
LEQRVRDQEIVRVAPPIKRRTIANHDDLEESRSSPMPAERKTPPRHPNPIRMLDIHSCAECTGVANVPHTLIMPTGWIGPANDWTDDTNLRSGGVNGSRFVTGRPRRNDADYQSATAAALLASDAAEPLQGAPAMLAKDVARRRRTDCAHSRVVWNNFPTRSTLPRARSLNTSHESNIIDGNGHQRDDETQTPSRTIGSTHNRSHSESFSKVLAIFCDHPNHSHPKRRRNCNHQQDEG